MVARDKRREWLLVQDISLWVVEVEQSRGAGVAARLKSDNYDNNKIFDNLQDENRAKWCDCWDPNVRSLKKRGKVWKVWCCMNLWRQEE